MFTRGRLKEDRWVCESIPVQFIHGIICAKVVSPIGKTQLSICIGQEVGIQSFSVARDLAQECIRGVDFMRAYKLIIDFDTIALKKNNKKMIKERKRKSCE